MPDYDQPSADGNAPVRDGPAPAKTFIVCGGRDHQDRDAVFRALDTLHRKHPNLTVIHGACSEPDDPTKLRGADRWANEWSLLNECPVIAVPAKWTEQGTSAGPRRNGLMLMYLPHGVVSFPGGAGTADMCRQAEAAGVRVWKP